MGGRLNDIRVWEAEGCKSWAIGSCSPLLGSPFPFCAVAGRWVQSSKKRILPDPLDGSPFIEVPDTPASEAGPFIESLRAVPKHGLHNPFKNPER